MRSESISYKLQYMYRVDFHASGTSLSLRDIRVEELVWAHFGERNDHWQAGDGPAITKRLTSHMHS